MSATFRAAPPRARTSRGEELQAADDGSSTQMLDSQVWASADSYNRGRGPVRSVVIIAKTAIFSVCLKAARARGAGRFQARGPAPVRRRKAMK